MKISTPLLFFLFSLPFLVSVSHLSTPLFDESDEVCIITKDPKSHWKPLLLSQGAPVKKVHPEIVKNKETNEEF
jgi:hypothetical protein